MAEFVRAQIFGTTFEITSRFVARERSGARAAMGGADVSADTKQVHRPATCGNGRLRACLVCSKRRRLCGNTLIAIQLCEGPAYWTGGCGEEDHEAFQHASAL